MMRGPSVRDRASRYEQTAFPVPSSSQLNTPNNNRYSMSGGAGPSSAPRTSNIYGAEYDNSPHTPLQGGPVPRAQGSAQKMIQQWENIPPAGAGDSPYPSQHRLQPTPNHGGQYNRDYLDRKPLPSPSNAMSSPFAPMPMRGQSTTPENTPPGPSRLYPPSPLRQSQTAEPSSRPAYPYSPVRAVQSQPSPIRTGLSPARYSMQPSPSKISFAPNSSNRHLQTPTRNQSRLDDDSPTQWSGSPGEKKRKGKSPLKEMFSAIGKRAKGKGKEKRESYGSGGYDITMDGGLKRVGSNGLPGGIVFRDRMGDQEMDLGPTETAERGIVRNSPILYLIPTPCSSVSQWGSWMTSWGVLTESSLRITFCPIFQEPQRSNSPRRTLDPKAPVPYQAIPAPNPSQASDVDLDMTGCAEVRSLRREELNGRHVPAAPEGVSTEVLEMVWLDGSRRYIGVEGVSGRIGWISAIWDVLLACKPEGKPLIPPPSPTTTPPRPIPDRDTFEPLRLPSGPPPTHSRPIDEPSPFREHRNISPQQSSPMRLYERSESFVGPVGNGNAPPVQKIGDRWVAASMVGKGGSEVSEATRRLQGAPDALRHSVKRMFDTHPQTEFPVPSIPIQEPIRLYMAGSNRVREYDNESDEGDPTIIPPRVRSPSPNGSPIRFDSNASLGIASASTKAQRDVAEKIRAWQPQTERELSIFARSPSRASSKSASRRKALTEADRDGSFKTDVSFDPSDLNPSRSASQVAIPREIPRRRGTKSTAPLPNVDENMPPATSNETGENSGFTPMAQKAFSQMSKNKSDTEQARPGTIQLPAGDNTILSGPKSNVMLSPMAERAFRFMAAKPVDVDMDDETGSHETIRKTPSKSREDRHTRLPKSVEMFSADTHSSETGESASVKTPNTDYTQITRPSPRTRAEGDEDVEMPDDGLTPGVAFSKLLPAYSDLSHPEQMTGMRDRKVSRSSAEQVNLASRDLQKVITCLTTLVGASKALEDPSTLPRGLDDRLNTIQLDVKAIENALNLSALRLPSPSTVEEQTPVTPSDTALPEVHARLDAIQRLCEEVLARHDQSVPVPVPVPVSDTAKPAKPAKKGTETLGLGLTMNDDEQSAGDEVAQIMAELTGGSNGGTSPRRGGLQVLHNVSTPASPLMSNQGTPAIPQEPMTEDVKKQVVEVLGLVKELKEARVLQTQQTTDIARYLNELNLWLEKFVQNSAVELSSMSKRLNTLVGPQEDDDDPDGAKNPKVPLPELVAEMHGMLAEQKKRAEAEGPVGQRLDGLLDMMGQDRERQAGQQGMVEQVLTILGRQRSDNEMLLRALANDLTSEIRGERIRFVEAMQQATTMNVTRHVEEFKKTLSAEVTKSIKELGKMREEKRALEHQIADLFALKAKFGGDQSRRGSVAPAPKANGGGAAPAGGSGGGGGVQWQGANIIQAMAAAANPYNHAPPPAAMATPGPTTPGARVLPAPPG